MAKSLLAVISILLLPACTPMPATTASLTISRQDQLACEQQALVAKSAYVARAKIPEHEVVNISQSWAGNARSDSGEWVFNSAYKTCLQHVASQQR